jgi:hypothetical protein
MSDETKAVESTPATEQDNDALALSILLGTDEPAKEAPVSPAEGAEAAVATPVAPTAPEAPKSQSDALAELLAARERASAEADRLRGELAQAKAEAAGKGVSAAKLEELRALVGKDPFKAFSELGVDSDKLYELLVNKKSEDPVQASYANRISALEAQIAERDQRDERARQAEQVQSSWKQIPGLVRQHMAKEVPSLIRVFDGDDAGLNEEIKREMNYQVHQLGNTDITPAKAAVAIEARYAKILPRREEPAAKASAGSITNVPAGTTKPVKTTDLTDAERDQLAVDILMGKVNVGDDKLANPLED